MTVLSMVAKVLLRDLAPVKQLLLLLLFKFFPFAPITGRLFDHSEHGMEQYWNKEGLQKKK